VRPFAEQLDNERVEADAWEQLYIAAIDLDTALPDDAHPAADLERLVASLHRPLNGDGRPTW